MAGSPVAVRHSVASSVWAHAGAIPARRRTTESDHAKRRIFLLPQAAPKQQHPNNTNAIGLWSPEAARRFKKGHVRQARQPASQGEVCPFLGGSETPGKPVRAGAGGCRSAFGACGKGAINRVAPKSSGTVTRPLTRR